MKSYRLFVFKIRPIFTPVHSNDLFLFSLLGRFQISVVVVWRRWKNLSGFKWKSTENNWRMRILDAGFASLRIGKKDRMKRRGEKVRKWSSKGEEKNKYDWPVGWRFIIHWLLLCRGLRPPPPKECPAYDNKQSDGEASVMLDLWGRRSTPPLESLLGPLWPGVVAPDRVQSLGQI